MKSVTGGVSPKSTFSNLGLTGVLLFSLASAASAQDNYTFQVQIAKVPGSLGKMAHAGLVSTADWNRCVEDKKIEILDELSSEAKIGIPALVMAGRKIPIIYPDPRTGAVQVQYTDAGFVFDLKVDRNSDGQLKIESTTSSKNPIANPSGYPQFDVLRQQGNFTLAPGISGLVGSVRGPLTPQYIKQLYPNARLGEQDAIVICVQVKESR